MKPFHASVTIAAPVERVWAALMDLERWSDWTPSIQGIDRLSAGPLHLSSRVRIRQPALLPAIWTVTDYRDRKQFIWTTRSPGAEVTASHRVMPAAGGSQVELLLAFRGALGTLIARIGRPMIHRYLSLEINGLKRECERRDVFVSARVSSRCAYSFSNNAF